MKILLITCKPPYPIIDGGCFASKRLIDTLLSQGNTVKLLTIATQKHPFNSEKHPAEIHAEGITIDTSLSIFGAMKHLFGKTSYNIERFRSSKMKDVILRTLEKTHYDRVIFDSLFSTPYIDDVRQSFDGKILLRAHNFETDIWNQKANSSSGLKKIYLRKLANDLGNYEKSIAQKVDGILTISSEDKARFESFNFKTKVNLVPVAIESIETTNYQSNQPFFIGGMDWEPNQLAVQKALKVLSDLNDSSLKLQLAGNGTEHFKSHPFANVHGRVDCAISFMKENGFLFAPIFSGSGVRIKILEAMSAGIPVLTTKLGASGIDKNALLIANTDHEMKEWIQKLNQNEDFRKEIGQKGQQFIQNELKLEDIGKKLQNILND